MRLWRAPYIVHKYTFELHCPDLISVNANGDSSDKKTGLVVFIYHAKSLNTASDKLEQITADSTNVQNFNFKTKNSKWTKTRHLLRYFGVNIVRALSRDVIHDTLSACMKIKSDF